MGARLFLATAALLALLAASRIGGNRALSPVPDLAGGRGKPTLVFLFQPRDCIAYAGLVRRWSALARDSALHVVGLGIGFGPPAATGDPILGEPKPAFPVRYDLTGAANRLLARLGHLETPTSVLLDARGRPLMIVPPVAEEAAQEHASTLLRAYARRLSGTSSRGGRDRPPRTDKPEQETES